ncbi:MAG: permease of the major facilitator superfamily [Chloroflexota bacterium]|jgi:PPP family 3-phenylpropionic acid transporter
MALLLRPGMRRPTLLYVVVGLMQACYMPYSGIVLHQRGVSLEAIGLVTAVNSFLALAAGPLWGHLGDATLGRVATFRLALFATATGVLLFAAGPFAGIPGTALAAFAGAGIVPLLDTIGMERLARIGGEWGSLRALTSASYSAMCIVGGGFVATIGAVIIGPSYALGALVVVVATIGLRLAAGEAHTAAEEAMEREEPAGGNAEIAIAGDWRDRFGTASAAFAQSPRLGAFLGLSLLANLGAGLFYAFGSIRIQEVGGDASTVALGGAISAAVEIPFFLAGGAIAARIGLHRVYSIGCAAIGAASLAYAVVADPLGLAVLRSLIGIGFACTLLGSVLSVRTIVPLHLQATGQALFQGVSYGLAIAIASIVGGIIYGELGALPLFALSALVLFASIPMALRVLDTGRAGA